MAGYVYTVEWYARRSEDSRMENWQRKLVRESPGLVRRRTTEDPKEAVEWVRVMHVGHVYPKNCRRPADQKHRGSVYEVVTEQAKVYRQLPRERVLLSVLLSELMEEENG